MGVPDFFFFFNCAVLPSPWWPPRLLSLPWSLYIPKSPAPTPAQVCVGGGQVGAAPVNRSAPWRGWDRPLATTHCPASAAPCRRGSGQAPPPTPLALTTAVLGSPGACLPCLGWPRGRTSWVKLNPLPAPRWRQLTPGALGICPCRWLSAPGCPPLLTEATEVAQGWPVGMGWALAGSEQLCPWRWQGRTAEA